ncbi:MAG: D-alanyl-D-alanine carboxypeptidase [Lachnospiraceae bacterium]|nr:D-alanyl-D-alanine carboxypeptidase [Lachnospiraceae bacterium]
MKRCLVYILTIILILANVSYTHINASAKEELSLYSLSAVLIDGDTGRVLYGKDEDTGRAMASTTKIMTLIIALEYGNMDDIVDVSSYASKMPDVQLGINEGEQYRLEDLIYSMMLESHNDSAVAIAEHIGGDVGGFADMMNQKAAELGLSDTYFITPNGLDSSDDKGAHHTTAKELALIMKYCIKDSPKKDEFINICQTRSYSFTDYSGKRSFTVNNKNAFLDMMQGVVAGKTGFTGDAGYCYVCAVTKDDKTLIVALLGCGWPNNKTYKWQDTKKLLNYGFEKYDKRCIFDRTYPLQSAKVKNGIENDEVDLYVDDEFNILLSDDDKVSYEVSLPDVFDAPVEKGDIGGSVIVYINDEPFKSFNVYIKDDIRRVNYRYYFNRVISHFLM